MTHADVSDTLTTSKMRGLLIAEYKKPYQFSTDIPIPKIEKPNEVLIKIAVAGYCHTEMMVVNGEFDHRMRGRTLPLIPSHEGTGFVVDIGSEVTNVKVGDRVGALTMKNACGNCSECRRKTPKYCENVEMLGLTVHGAAAEYMVADAAWVIHLPQNLSFETAAPLMCAGCTVYCALKTANLNPGDTVGIIGAGALGHLGVQFAKCMGLWVVCVDSRQAPLELVKGLKFKPDYAIDATKGVEYALAELKGLDVDAVLMCTDSVPAHEYGLQLVRKHGTYVVVGQPFDPIPVHYRNLIGKNLILKGSLLSDPTLAQEMVNMVAEKGIQVKTRSYPLEDVQKLIDDYGESHHSGKLVLRVSAE